MITVKAKIHPHSEETPIVPIVVPDLDEVRTFANALHRKAERWEGEVFGWSAEYNPERAEPPLDSRMTFTPADFVIGESGIWFFSMLWERGQENAPVEFLDDENIMR